MTVLTWTSIGIIAVGIIGLILFVLIHTRLRGQEINLRHVWVQNSTRLTALLGSAYLILVGFSFHSLSNFWWDVLRGFLLVTGFQILLNVVGISLELLGNNPADVERAGQGELS
jgi:hypothetical protein